MRYERLFSTLLVKVLLILWVLIDSRPIYAQNKGIMDSEQVILCVIGEAEDQGYDGMLAIAYAIRNRQTLKGVYGCKAKRVINRQYDDLTYKEAKKAWEASASGKDITMGATHWENIKQFGKPYWVKKMKKTVQIKDHVFYK